MTDELFKEYKDELDDEWHDTFNQLTAQGKSPSGILATIEYVTTKKTQQEVALEYDVSDVTIRNLQAAVIALGPRDERRGSAHRSDRTSPLDDATYIADCLGWERGEEYNISDNYGSSRQPRMLAKGWRDLRERIGESGDIE